MKFNLILTAISIYVLNLYHNTKFGSSIMRHCVEISCVRRWQNHTGYKLCVHICNMSRGFSSSWVTSIVIPWSHIPPNIARSSPGPCRKAAYIYATDSTENLTATSSDVAPQRENSGGRVKLSRNCRVT